MLVARRLPPPLKLRWTAVAFGEGGEPSDLMIDIDVRTIASRVGEQVAVSDWLDVTQARIDQFADATGDHHWIHVDAARAAAESPFKRTIAHGFLTLSLLSTLIRESIRFTGLRMAINYGLNRVRFVSPVPSGSRIRARITLQTVDEVSGGVQVTWAVTIEREGGEKPSCVADWIVRYYPE
jgi:acyl dehydratase